MNESIPSETWLTRSDLSGAGFNARSGTGLLLASPLADVAVGLGRDALDRTVETCAAGLVAAGVLDSDRVVVALAADGELGGPLYAQAAARVSAAAICVDPRGRMRTTKVLEAVRANVLVITPTGAMDLLARLHMEFLADPLDLELRMLLLVGEISEARTYKHLAREFGAEVVELLADPVLAVPIAHRHPTSSDDGWLTVESGPQLHLARLDVDALLEAPYPAGLAEIVVQHPWHQDLAGIRLRTGYVARSEDQSKAAGAPAHTVGDHLLLRGRWLSLARLEDAMRVIDGITRLRLEVERKGTLDTVTLHVAFGRESLTNNPMWRGRIEQALTDLTPFHIDVVVGSEVHETAEPLEVLDRRGHHLGRSRSGIL